MNLKWSKCVTKVSFTLGLALILMSVSSYRRNWKVNPRKCYCQIFFFLMHPLRDHFFSLQMDASRLQWDSKRCWTCWEMARPRQQLRSFSLLWREGSWGAVCTAAASPLQQQKQVPLAFNNWREMSQPAQNFHKQGNGELGGGASRDDLDWVYPFSREKLRPTDGIWFQNRGW